MAEATEVDNQVTDSTTTANMKVLTEAPGQAVGQMYLAMSNAKSRLADNAVQSQVQGTATAQAATSMCVSFLLSGVADASVLNTSTDTKHSKKKD